MYNYNSYCAKMRGKPLICTFKTMKLKNYLHKTIIFVSLITFNAYASTEQYLNSIRNQPIELYAFFQNMPKGGELHYHFTGSSYPEELINIAKNNRLYINPNTYAVNKSQISSNVTTRQFFAKPESLEETIRAWSMHNLVADFKSRHDHFFNVFGKVNAIYKKHPQELLASQLTQAAKQNEIYIEIILVHLENASDYQNLIKDKSSLQAKQTALLKSRKFQRDIDKLVKQNDNFIINAYKYLGCHRDPSPKACQIVIRTQAFVVRETNMDDFFTGALAAFAAADRGKNIVGVNIVQPENGKLALANFPQQMQVFKFLHQAYPNVNIAMHAGELSPKTSNHQSLKSHITESIFTASAQRIGHGTDIRHETNHLKTLNYMAQNNIPVEISLTSNKLILSISGAEQPINYYLKHNVPVILSTDDQGILQTDLTKQYVDAALTYNLDYSTLKAINRSSLTYSFIPGKSIWENPRTGKPVKECEQLNSQSCRIFIKNNQKAFLQWILEDRLQQFEKKYTLTG